MKISKEDLRQLMIPVLERFVRLAIVNLFSLNEFVDLLRRLYVVQAQKWIQDSQGKSSVSAVSVLTGLHRKEVSRLMREHEDSGYRKPTLLSKIISAWEQGKLFRDAAGKPRPLTCTGYHSEFGTLCSGVTNDVGTGAILDQLSSHGLVEIREGLAYLKGSVVLHNQNSERGFSLSGEILQLFVQSCAENLLARKDPPNLLIRTMYDSIPEENVSEIRNWVHERGLSFHREARAKLSSVDSDLNISASSVERSVTVAVCSFSVVLENTATPVKR